MSVLISRIYSLGLLVLGTSLITFVPDLNAKTVKVDSAQSEGSDCNTKSAKTPMMGLEYDELIVCDFPFSTQSQVDDDISDAEDQDQGGIGASTDACAHDPVMLVGAIGPVTCTVDTNSTGPNIFPTIQECLNNPTSVPGVPWVVRVQPGTYRENIVIDTTDYLSGLHLFAGSSPMSNTPNNRVIIDGSTNARPCIELIGGATTEPIIIGRVNGVESSQWRGFVLTGGTGVNSLSGGDVVGGGGIRADFVSNLIVMGNLITGNQAAQRGGGIYFNIVTGTIALNQISGNVTGSWPQDNIVSAEGAGVAQVNGNLLVMHNVLSNNRFDTNFGNDVNHNRRGGGAVGQSGSAR